MKNSDYVRNMSDEELSTLLSNNMVACQFCHDYMIDSTNCGKNCSTQILKGLQEEYIPDKPEPTLYNLKEKK